MKLILTSLILIAALSTNAQILTDEKAEQLVSFKSVLVDYEIHHGNVVAITKKNREYFIYFTDTKGAKLYDQIDIFFPTDLEIDCMGNLFLVGLDSAFQLKITNFVEKVQSFDLASYKSTIESCKAYFDENLVRSAELNVLLYEPITDSLFEIDPVVSVIEIWYGQQFFIKNQQISIDVNPDSMEIDETEVEKNTNEGFSVPYPFNHRNAVATKYRRPLYIPNELSPFQCGDSLWVILEQDDILLIYSNIGECAHVQAIHGLPLNYRLIQSKSDNSVYALCTSSGTSEIRRIKRNGELEKIGSIYKGLSKGDLKISNGYLYFRDSKGVGESIKRVKLN